MLATPNRLRKHADYQRVYKSSRKQFSKQIAFFFALRPALGPDGQPLRAPETPRVGLTVGKVLGKAVDRNRIKRRLREAVRKHLALLSSPVDVILHPRRTVLDLDFALLEREVAQIFRTIEKLAARVSQPEPRQALSSTTEGQRPAPYQPGAKPQGTRRETSEG